MALRTSEFLIKRKILNQLNINLIWGLHPVARVISYDMGFNPSTQL
jgi:hypothetical protein